MTAAAEHSVVVVVAYDIKDNRRREDVSQYLSQHGARVQLSVFEIELSHKRKLNEVQATLKNLIMDAEDQIRLWPQPAAQQPKAPLSSGCADSKSARTSISSDR